MSEQELRQYEISNDEQVLALAAEVRRCWAVIEELEDEQ